MCLSKSCLIAPIFCEQNKSAHSDHFIIPILDFCAILSSSNHKIESKLGIAKESFSINDSFYEEIKSHFLDTQQLISQTFSDVLNLYQFNKDIGNKILQKNLNILQDWKQF